jgi:hypothetical protein
VVSQLKALQKLTDPKEKLKPYYEHRYQERKLREDANALQWRNLTKDKKLEKANFHSP